jgi:hypothetical protein
VIPKITDRHHDAQLWDQQALNRLIRTSRMRKGQPLPPQVDVKISWSRGQGISYSVPVLGCKLGNLWRRLVQSKIIDHWSFTSLQQRLVKTGGRLIKHARYYWLLLAESHLTRRLFGGMLRRIAALPSPAI